MVEEGTIQDSPMALPTIQHDRTIASLLEEMNIPYTEEEFMLQVGEPEDRYDWIIHLSIATPYLKHAILKLCPKLYQTGIPFKIPDGTNTTINILEGQNGIENIGKVITIYPRIEDNVDDLANLLVTETLDYKGPTVYTDAYLGGCVYSRKGAYKKFSVIEKGHFNGYFYYDERKTLIEDEIRIPFTINNTTAWPFSRPIKPTTIPHPPSAKTFYTTEKIKDDPKGSVYFGYYKASWGIPKPCVIKQGIKNMMLQEDGLDMGHRIKHQYELQKRLSAEQLMPTPYEIVETEDAVYLVMEKITGSNLVETARKLNPRMASFWELEEPTRAKLASICIQLCESMKLLHKNKVVFRDGSPVNFMFTNNHTLKMIDVELAKDLLNDNPKQHIRGGTNGYMSNQQKNNEPPTVHDDYFAIAASTIMILLGIHPFVILSDKNICNSKLLSILCNNTCISSKLRMGLSPIAEERTDLTTLASSLKETTTKKETKYSQPIPAKQAIENTIEWGLNGLVSSPTVLIDDLWTTQLTYDASADRPRNIHTIDPHIFDGQLGISYFISIAAISGFPTSHLKPYYKKNFQFAVDTILGNNDTNTGFHYGSAGLSLAIFAGMKSEFLQKHPDTINLAAELSEKGTKEYSLANGIAGSLWAISNSIVHFSDDSERKRLLSIAKRLVSKIAADGRLKRGYISAEDKYYGSYLYDQPGVGLSLWEYYGASKDEEVISLIQLIDPSIHKHSDRFEKEIKRNGLYETFGKGRSDANSLLGIIRYLLTAYRNSGNSRYVERAKNLLNYFPDQIVTSNFTLYSGLSGLGLIYLEIFTLTGAPIYERRADWIAALITSAARTSKNDCIYWGRDVDIPMSPGLMTGTSGILLFLMKYVRRETPLPFA